MLKSDDYRLRDIEYLIEFGEFDMARTKLATLQTEASGDPLLRELETKLAMAPQGSVDPYGHLSSKMNYADSNELSNFAADPRGWPGICVKLGALLSILGIFLGKAFVVIPALLHGWNTPMVLAQRSSRGFHRDLDTQQLVYGRTVQEFHVTAGQMFMENAIFLLVGPLLLIVGIIGTVLAHKRRLEL